MPEKPPFGKKEDSSLVTQVVELKDMVIAYAKQETIEPLKSLGRFVGAGLGGAVLLSIGLVLLGLAMLRALQEETGTRFTGNLTWVPYLLTMLAGIVVIVLAARAIGKPKRKRSRS